MAGTLNVRRGSSLLLGFGFSCLLLELNLVAAADPGNEIEKLQQEVVLLQQDKLRLQDECLKLHRLNEALTLSLLDRVGREEKESAARLSGRSRYLRALAASDWLVQNPISPGSTPAEAGNPSSPSHIEQSFAAGTESLPVAESSAIFAGSEGYVREAMAPLHLDFISERQMEFCIASGLLLPYCFFCTCLCCRMPPPQDEEGRPLQGCQALVARVKAWTGLIAYSALLTAVFALLEVTGCLSQMEGMTVRWSAEALLAIGALLAAVHSMSKRLHRMEEFLKFKIEEMIQRFEDAFLHVGKHLKEKETEAEGAAWSTLHAAEDAVAKILHFGDKDERRVSVPEDASDRGNYQLLQEEKSETPCLGFCGRKASAPSEQPS